MTPALFFDLLFYASSLSQNSSLEHLVSRLESVYGIEMEKQSFDERFTEKAVGCVKSVLSCLIRAQFSDMLISEGFLSDFNYVRIKDYPSGMIQLLLFDENMNPLSERLIFNKSKDRAEAVFKTDKQEYGRREKVQAELSIRDADGVIMAGNLSLSITDDRDAEIDLTTTIGASLLLSSE